MFLSEVVIAVFDEQGFVTFNGNIRAWAFVKEIETQGNTKNRDKGIMELKSTIITRDVMINYFCQKVILTIEA